MHAHRRLTCYRPAPKENPTADHIDVTIPVEPEVARALADPVHCEAAGRVPSSLLKRGHIRDVLAEAIAGAKREARAIGLTDSYVDTELQAWRAEPRA